LLVRHLCNNPRCINPAHLREGIRKENLMDSIVVGTALARSEWK
jgi:hypothetical protein